MTEIKEKIRRYEELHNGFNRLNMHWVEVVNLRERKDKYIADIILVNGEDNIVERYNGCEYPKELFREELVCSKK